eukprot:11576_4
MLGSVSFLYLSSRSATQVSASDNRRACHFLIILRTPTILLAASDSGMRPILTRLLFSAHLRAIPHNFTHIDLSSSVFAS